MLQLFDQFFAVFGMLVLILWARRSLRSRRLLPAPPLPVREEFPLTAILAYFGAALLLAAVIQSAAPNDEVLKSLVVNNGAQISGILACLVLASQRLPGGFLAFFRPTSRLHTATRRSGALEVVLLSIVAIGVCPIISNVTAWLIRLNLPDYSFDSHPTLKALAQDQLSFGRTLVLWMGAAVVAPIAEELFFRGVLQDFLRNHLRTGSAVLITSSAFALVHLSQPHALPALFFLSVLLGVIYLRTTSLVAPMLIHALFNLKTLVWESLARAV